MASFIRSLFELKAHRHPIDKVAGVNSVISAVALFPQLFTLLKEPSSGGLSPLAFFLIALNSGVWFAYGLHRGARPLVVSSACNAFVSVGILLLIYLKP